MSWLDKVIIGTSIFASVIANVPAPVELVMTQVNDVDRISLILELIKSFPTAL